MVTHYRPVTRHTIRNLLSFSPLKLFVPSNHSLMAASNLALLGGQANILRAAPRAPGMRRSCHAIFSRSSVFMTLLDELD
jgi:hypothetical protein